MVPRDARCVLCPEQWHEGVKRVMRSNIQASIAVGKVVAARAKGQEGELRIDIGVGKGQHEWWPVPTVV